MGLAVTFKWRGLVSFVVESGGINCKFGSGIKSSLCSVSTFQKVVRLSRVQTRPSSKYEVSPHLGPAS